MSSPGITKVGMIILMEPDMSAAILFFEKLGIKKQFELEDRWVEFSIGDVKLGLCKTPHEATEQHAGFVLEVDDLYKFYEEMKDKVTFHREPKAAQHGIMATIKDPGGNLIDLYQPTTQKFKETVEQAMTEKAEK